MSEEKSTNAEENLKASFLRALPVFAVIAIAVLALVKSDQGQDILRGAEDGFLGMLYIGSAIALLIAVSCALAAEFIRPPKSSGTSHAPMDPHESSIFSLLLYLCLLLILAAVGCMYATAFKSFSLGGVFESAGLFVLLLALTLLFGFALNALFRRRYGLVATGAGIVLMLAIAPTISGRWLGSAMVLVLGLLGWLILAAAFARVRKDGGIPDWAVVVGVIVIVVALIVVPSFRERMRGEVRYKQGASFDDAVAKVLEKQQGTRPVIVIVAAAGGGVRASYWTAKILARASDRAPTLRDKMVLASGVSGGSVGLALYRALLAEEKLDCPQPEKKIEPCVAAFHRRGFLAPAISSALTGELIDRVLPVFPRPSVALERSWEASWRAIAPGSDRFKAPFEDLWAADGPALVLNTTSAYDGDRLPISNLSGKINNPTGEGKKFSDQHWLNSRGRCKANVAEELKLPLSVAANASARFPFLEDWGLFTVHGVDATSTGCRPREFVADGGFFDNYGAATALDAYKEIRRFTSTLPEERRPRIIVIQITSDPECQATHFLGSDAFAGECQTALVELHKGLDRRPLWPLTRNWFSNYYHNTLQPYFAMVRPLPEWKEDPGPFGVLMRARATNGITVAEDLRRQAMENGDSYHLFSMAGAFDAPLGWELSHSAQKQLDSKLDSPANSAAMEKLVTELNGQAH